MILNSVTLFLDTCTFLFHNVMTTLITWKMFLAQ